jgi:hypothetical protein
MFTIYFISCQWSVNEICVSFYPVEAKCNHVTPSHDDVLDIHDEVPVAFCIMEDTVGF